MFNFFYELWTCAIPVLQPCPYVEKNNNRYAIDKSVFPEIGV